MLSKLIKDKIHARFGNEIRYAKDCETLAQDIAEKCKGSISVSTLLRLYGFGKGMREPRLYTLDVIAEYLGYKSWESLIGSLDKEPEPVKLLERLNVKQINPGQTVRIAYEPRKIIEIRKTGAVFHVVSSNERRLLLNDEVKFQSLELHYPLTFTHVIRQGNSIGRVQLATVSGIISIKKN